MDARKAHQPGRGVRWAAWALAAALAWPAAAGAAGRVALVIGNSAYDSPDAVLPNPVNDADAMKAALGRLGFKVVLGKDLDKEGFFVKLKEFVKAARGADVALFFYAGHGLQVDGKNWLMPINASGLEDKLDLEHRAVMLNHVMGNMPGRHNLVFLDACRNNPLARGLARSMRLSRADAPNRGLARVPVQSGSGVFIGYATAEGEVASDGTDDNSPFTKALLAHIEDPRWSVGEMFGKVVESVMAATGKKQVPWSESSLSGDPLHLASAAVVAPPKATTAPAAGGTPASSGDAARAYEATERAGTVAAYRAFIRRYPSSFEAELAQAQIDKLEAKPEPIVVAGGDPEEEVSPVVTPPPPSPEAVHQGLGLSVEAIRLIQMGLAAAGQAPGQVDGVFGGRTRKAIRAWQESKELEVTGYLTREQSEGLAALGREEAERRRVAAERKEREEAERKEREAEERRLAEAERERQRKARAAEEAARRARAEAERKEREAEERRKRARRPGATFEDCPGCPEMVVVPGGQFGSPFAVGVYEVTFGEWDACVSGGGCGGYRPDDLGWGRGRRPVIYVSWHDAQAYVRWLSGKTREAYRLLSEAEWKYVARAGTTTEYWWGDDIGRNRANCDDRCGDSYRYTAPVGSFSANPFGLYDVHGNVWEWVGDCLGGGCSRRVLRGGSFGDGPSFLSSALRNEVPSGFDGATIGFRVARTLTP